MAESNLEMIVTPLIATCNRDGFEYDKLIEKFGVKKIDQELIDRLERVTGSPAHIWIKRGIIFAHRDLDVILDDYESGKQIYIYTGRGPTTASLHLGHMIPLMFTKWLQDVFGAILVIQIADDEKYYFKDTDFSSVYEFGKENAKDIIACGFDCNKTFIFSSRDYNRTAAAHNLIHDMYKKISIKDIKAIFGSDDSSNIGKYVWPIYQMAPSMSKYFEPIFGNNNVRCLVPYAIDQDPYFRGVRDIAPKLQCFKPSAIISKFLPALNGLGKMSSTAQSVGTRTTEIFLNEDPKNINKIINKCCFSGGKDSIEEQRKLGANLAIDIAYQYLKYFMVDDIDLQRVALEYSSGKMLSGEIKRILSDIITELLINHQVARSKITNADLDAFYDINKFT